VVIYLNQRKDMFLSTFYTHQFNKFISCWLRSCILICIYEGLKLGSYEHAYTEFRWGDLRERDHLRDPSLDGRIILTWIFRMWGYGLD